MLAHWQRAGHRPIALMGGATGLIGDPSGKGTERVLLDRDRVPANIENYQATFERVLDFDCSGEHRATIVNNHDWLGSLGYIHMLGDVGKHSVNMMIQKESVSLDCEREQGISYTEFSYMILEYHDFLHLNRTMNCTVQIGGADQYGNIVAGIDLIRRLVGRETTPPPTPRDGLRRHQSPGHQVRRRQDRQERAGRDRLIYPPAFYQFWLNTADEDVAEFLKWFTFEDRERIEALERSTGRQAREAQRVLAESMTRMIHGDHEYDRARPPLARSSPGRWGTWTPRCSRRSSPAVPSSRHPVSSWRARARTSWNSWPRPPWLPAGARPGSSSNGANPINGSRSPSIDA